MRRVAVTGGRDWRDRGHVWRVLDGVHKTRGIGLLVVGDCPTGADLFARQWAAARLVRMVVEAAEWEVHGRAAGPIRNQAMLDKHRPAVLIAFPGNRGTADMVRRAKAANIPVIQSL